MLHQSAQLTAMLPAIAMMNTLNTRFGPIMLDTDKAVTFPRGLLGMPDKFNFMVTAFSSAKMQQFTLLQSADDENLSFITLPLPMNNPVIAVDDLRKACRDLHIAEADLVILLIVSVHRGLGKVKLSVNARAPLLVDAGRKTGLQYVFQNDAYKVQHIL